ncbi:hypothetical protein RIF29_48312 [Crotalaria pallida]|uniref:Uncharacterized protein n=1 Tax=Crotalaria pallida TaxID=3830 RepID=A0AAN9DQ66_CROPI
MKGLFIITERDKPKRKLPKDALRRVATPCHATLFAYIALEANAKPVPSRPKSTSKLSRLAPLSETTAQPGAKSRNATMPRACIAQDATSKEPVPSRPDRTWGRSDSWTKERSLDASALHPTCQTISHRGARIFPSDQHAPGHVRPGFGSTDDSLESPPRHGKTLHTSTGWLEKALGEAPMAHHPDPPWCKGRQPASPPYNRLICQNAPCTSGYPFC